MKKALQNWLRKAKLKKDVRAAYGEIQAKSGIKKTRLRFQEKGLPSPGGYRDSDKTIAINPTLLADRAKELAIGESLYAKIVLAHEMGHAADETLSATNWALVVASRAMKLAGDFESADLMAREYQRTIMAQEEKAWENAMKYLSESERGEAERVKEHSLNTYWSAGLALRLSKTLESAFAKKGA